VALDNIPGIDLGQLRENRQVQGARRKTPCGGTVGSAATRPKAAVEKEGRRADKCRRAGSTNSVLLGDKNRKGGGWTLTEGWRKLMRLFGLGRTESGHPPKKKTKHKQQNDIQ